MGQQTTSLPEIGTQIETEKYLDSDLISATLEYSILASIETKFALIIATPQFHFIIRTTMHSITIGDSLN